MRVADNLHVTVALLRIPADSQKVLKPGIIYSYDLSIVDGATTHTLGSLGLLKSVDTTERRRGGQRAPAPRARLRRRLSAELRAAAGEAR